MRVDELTPRRCRRYLGLRWLVGGLGAGVLLMLVLCVVVAGSMLSAWALGGSWGLIENSADRVDTWLVLVAGLPGILLTFVCVAGVSAVGTLDRWLAAQLLGPDARRALARRVAELTTTRAEVIDAVTDERRRIERDLHDGVQQRLVALGMLIGRARRLARSAQHGVNVLPALARWRRGAVTNHQHRLDHPRSDRAR